MCLPLHHSAFLKPCDHLATTAGLCFTPETMLNENTFYFQLLIIMKLYTIIGVENRLTTKRLNIAETKNFKI